MPILSWLPVVHVEREGRVRIRREGSRGVSKRRETKMSGEKESERGNERVKVGVGEQWTVEGTRRRQDESDTSWMRVGQPRNRISAAYNDGGAALENVGGWTRRSGEIEAVVKSCEGGDGARWGRCRGLVRRANRVQHGFGQLLRWLPMV